VPPELPQRSLLVYRADAIERLGQPFDDRVECYYDDKHLGLRLWGAGYKLLHVPLVVAYHLGSASYAGRSKLKSPQWLKGVAVAELAPSHAAGSPVRHIVTMYYGALAVALSLITASNHVKRYIAALKEAKTLKQDAALNRSSIELIPLLKPIPKLNRLERGVALASRTNSRSRQ